MDELLDLLSGLGYALDTPGAYTRGLLAGRPGDRVSGEEMLEAWTGGDHGAVSGMLAEMLLDPVNLLGVGAFSKVGKANKYLGDVAQQLGPRYSTKLDDVADILSSVPGRASDMDASRLSRIDKRAFSEIHPDSTLVGEGAEAYVFQSPDGSVVRLSRMKDRPPRVRDKAVMVQPTRDVVHGGNRVEWLPNTPPPERLPEKVRSAFERYVKKRGHTPDDIVAGNVTFHGGKVRAIDPGSVIPRETPAEALAVEASPLVGILSNFAGFGPAWVRRKAVDPGVADPQRIRDALLAALLGHNVLARTDDYD